MQTKQPYQQKQTNSRTVDEYLKALETEVNPSRSYQIITQKVLTQLLQFHSTKSFKNMEREDILSFLNLRRKSDKEDKNMNSWIGTYNLYLTILIRFFKWLYNPILEPNQRPKPAVIQNTPQLKRKEVSIYKPSPFQSLKNAINH